MGLKAKKTNFKTNWYVYWKGFFKVLLFTLTYIWYISDYIVSFDERVFFQGGEEYPDLHPEESWLTFHLDFFPSWFFSILIFTI